MIFSFSCSLSTVLVFPLFIMQYLYYYMNIHLSLPQLTVKRCKQRMWKSWREARPTSPAACRTTTAPSWSSRIPVDRLSSLTAREVRSCMHVCLFLTANLIHLCRNFHPVAFEASLCRRSGTDTTTSAFDVILVIYCSHLAFIGLVLKILTVMLIQEMGVLSYDSVTALTSKKKKKNSLKLPAQFTVNLMNEIRAY